MKFQFKEGQWFDVRKLTDWQKQWCLDNLDWVSEKSKSFINCKDPHIMYCNYNPLLKGMAGMSSEWCEPENEITFNDFYWGDEEVEDSFDNLVYVKPENDSTILYKNLSDQQLSFLLNSLTFNTRYGHNESDATHLSYDSEEGVWFTEVGNHNPKDIMISFNYIFKEVN